MMVLFPKKYAFIPKMIKDLQSPADELQHIMRLGGSTRGKLYHWAFCTEVGLNLHLIKPWGVWCPKWENLTDYMSFLIPNNQPLWKYENKMFRPRRFKVRIYVPISEKIPKWLPKGLIVPYTVSIGNLTEPIIQMLMGNVMTQSYVDEYNRLRFDDMDLADFKSLVLQSKSRKMVIRKGFNNTRMLSAIKGNVTILDQLTRRINDFEDEGIASTIKNRFALEKWLDKEVYDQETVVINYTGFIKNENLRKVISIYFMECLKEACFKQYNNMKQKVGYKHIVHFNELETLVVKSKDKAVQVTDAIINRRLRYYASTIRHSNIQLHFDCKGITQFDTEFIALIKQKYFFGGIDESNELQKIVENKGYPASLLLEASQEWTGKVRRFLDLSEKPYGWKRGEIKHYGYEFPRPRLCISTKAYLNLNDFRKIHDEETTKLFSIMIDSKLLKNELSEMWSIKEEKSIFEHEERIKKEQQEKEKTISKDNAQQRLVKVKMLEEMGIITRAKQAFILGIEERQLYRDLNKIKIQEKIESSQ